MARRRFQRGTLLKLGTAREPRWYGRWYEDVIVQGKVRRIHRQEFLGTVKEFPTKRLAMRELDGRLQTINSPVYRARPTATFAEFAKRWETEVVSQFKPSTASNYRMHLCRAPRPVLRQVSGQGHRRLRWCQAIRSSTKVRTKNRPESLRDASEHVAFSACLEIRGHRYFRWPHASQSPTHEKVFLFSRRSSENHFGCEGTISHVVWTFSRNRIAGRRIVRTCLWMT